MDKDAALKLALAFIERVNREGWVLADFEREMYAAIAAIKESLVQPVRAAVDAAMTERAKFEAWCDEHWDSSAYLHKSRTCGEWAAWQAARADVPVLLAQVYSLRTCLQGLLDATTKDASKAEMQARTLLLTLRRFGGEL